MESLEAKAVPSCSGGADAPEPSDCECQRRRRGRMSMHQRDDQSRSNAELRRSARSRQTPDERDAGVAMMVNRGLLEVDRRLTRWTLGVAMMVNRGGLLEVDRRLRREMPGGRKIRRGGLLGEQDRMPRAQTGLTYECTRAPAPAPFALELLISAPIAEPGCCVGRRSPCAVVMEGSRPLLSLPCLKAGKRGFGRRPSGHSAGSTTTALRVQQWESRRTRASCASQSRAA